MINSLIVLGGGTSGMIAALMIKKAWPSLEIKVIESSQLGIIGVGEGSTEHWKFFINYTDIKLHELMQETGATLKVGIKFTNWHGDGTHYFHSLIADYGHHCEHSGLPVYWYKMISEDFDVLRTCGPGTAGLHYEPLQDNTNQYHFDTFKLNAFLHKKCIERGIILKDCMVKDIDLDEKGFVKSLITDDNQLLQADFFVDCSGFRRTIITKLGSKWLDKNENLPMNSAIAFPTGFQEDLPSYTEATALSSGWNWRIPTQERFGNGYVYCDNFIDDDAAFDEVYSHYKNNLRISEEIKIGKKIKFSAGYLEKFWINNCVAIGLSGIFVEPLEASSIGTTIQQVAMLIPSLGFYSKGENFTSAKYNKTLSAVAENIIDFIQLHYFTQRTDTKFWRWCAHEITKTDFNKSVLEQMKKNGVNPFYFNEHFLLFKHLNFMQVMHGLRMFETKHLSEVYQKQLRDRFEKRIQDQINFVESTIDKSYTHREAIEELKKRGTEIKYQF